MPKSIKKEIDLELKKGHHDMAVKLASKGLQLFPADNELKKIADILAPPKVIQKNIPPSKGLQESMNWLKENRSKYQGQWIALQDGILLGHAESREQLADVLGNVDLSETLITKLP